MSGRLSGLHKGSPGCFVVEKDWFSLLGIEHRTHQPVAYSLPHVGENTIFPHKSTDINTLIMMYSMAIFLLFGNTRIIEKTMREILNSFNLE
jgi:hypothetical protein